MKNATAFLLSALAVFATALGAYAEPKAEDILGAASILLATQESFKVGITVRLNMELEDISESVEADYALAFRRPNSFSLDLQNSDLRVLWVSNGKDMKVYVEEFKQYTVKTDVPHAKEVIAKAGFGPISNSADFLTNLVIENPFMDRASEASSITYKGEESVNGFDCHHLRFSTGPHHWDLWVDAGDKPIIRRLSPDVVRIEEDLATQGVDGVRLSYNIDFQDWTLGGVGDDDFTFSPEPGVVKVASFTPPEPVPEAAVLLGKTAPPFVLELFGGGTLDIAAKQGKEIVVLDFWATWCLPCRKAMPIIEKVTSEFAGDGVRLYTVNQMETVKQIKDFLKDENLTVTVAMDTEGHVSVQYSAYSLPQTVIIGKDGTVQAVHVGISLATEDILRTELQTLVDGKSLVE